MKFCDVVRCKREALGMTQAQLAEVVGVSPQTISNFENGSDVSPAVFNSIRYGLEDICRNLSKEEYFEMQLLTSVMSLKYESEQRKLKTLQHIQVHAGKLALIIMENFEERD
jgi:transcriptional regulator with XRE-family HTH domain